ncbi:alpha/beta fold hydrolase [Plantactinospora soyae]|uniref:Pimeloyl-ACP methyl ester carboxylesterase n=1 Tax=Plantactinospora soyae TaxID=1544732 RepID=A0A927M1Y8_9ACTN|nr:alpha/beta hydrolase [Plantactinospora soyae]MBE1486139.1 pimeloyl-ACP methyl ester carboxylesterase [Plantactinospora soyae]
MNILHLDRGQGRIGYDVQGEGPLVVCVPGMGDVRSVFRFTVPALRDAGYRVATMDLRGHGDSSDGFDRYDDAAIATDLLALVDHLGGGPAVVVGHSLGTGAGILAALAEPGRIAGLALIGPFVREPDFSPLARLAYRLMLLRPWGPAVWAGYYRRFHPGRPPTDLAEHQARIRRSLGTGDHWRSFVRTARTAMRDRAAARRLTELRTPTLVVMGEKDADFPDPPAEGRYAAAQLRADLLLVPDAGHYPMAEYPEVVNPTLVRFVDRVTASAPVS